MFSQRLKQYLRVIRSEHPVPITMQRMIFRSVGMLTERLYLFLAEVSEGGRVGDGGGVAHEGESIEVVEVPLAELFAMATSGALEDAKTLVIVQRLMIEALERPGA